MFGLGKRKRFNGDVDASLASSYQIRTRNNPLFPAVLAYLELLDLAWQSKMSVDEAALYIATLYYCGIAKAGHIAEAEPLLSRINELSRLGLSLGTISEQRAQRFMAAIEDTNNRIGLAASKRCPD